MKYNDYIILTDEDYNNIKSRYNILDEIDKEKLQEIYNALSREYVLISESEDSRYKDILDLTRSHMGEIRDILSSSGVEVETVQSESVQEKRPRYYNPLSRLFMLNRPRPPRPPFNPNRNELDIIDLLLLYMILRPHGRHSSTICRMAHERIGVLSRLNVE